MSKQLLGAASSAAWWVCNSINRILPDGQLPFPKWAPERLLKSWERTPMTLGVPRKTLSLCPMCNREVANAFLTGRATMDDFRDQPGIVEAEILEEAGCILMRKACDKHGPFQDVLSRHPAFFRRMEALAFGRDFECIHDDKVHNHGINGIKTGRGTYLIVDITNRCNMVCSPCYMNANATTYVHELSLSDVKSLFERALSFKPQREINVLFSGGEATISPILLDAIKVAKGMGFHRIHVATNGIRFAQDRQFAFRAKAAGLHAVYLQFDGVSEGKNKHRGIANYMEVKYRALENIAAAGMLTTLQVSVINGLNNDGMGDIVRFALDNSDKIHGVIFQPVMFSGRDEDIADDERYRRRYPVSQIAYDLQEQSQIGWEPMRDWFPVSAYGIFAQLTDVLYPDARVGSLFNDIHPNHGIFSPLLVNTQTKRAVPVGSFFNIDGFMRDVVTIIDSGRRPAVIRRLVALSVLHNFQPHRAPSGLRMHELRGIFQDLFYRIAGSCENWSERAYSHRGPWKIMIPSAMWFQDLFMYDLSTMRESTTPVATQEGEISFSAYNSARWREVVERVHRTATLPEWHRKHSRHEIYSKGQRVNLPDAGREQLVQIESEAAAVTVLENVLE